MTQPPLPIYKITAYNDASGRNHAEYDDGNNQFKCVSSSATTSHMIARKLQGAGLPDGIIEAYSPEGKLLYQTNNIYTIAPFTIREGDRGIRRVKWSPGPF